VIAAPNSARLPFPKHPGHSNMPALCAIVQSASMMHAAVGAIVHCSVFIVVSPLLFGCFQCLFSLF
jgi:hypothetical protein